MKKLILTSLTAAGMAVAAMSSHAQGTVNFVSAAGGSCITSNTATSQTAKITAGQFAFGLYVGTTTNALLASTQPVLVVTNAGFGGIISGQSSITVPGLATGTTYIFQIKGWSVADGKSYEAALASGDLNLYAGVTAIGVMGTGDGQSVQPTGLFGGSTGGVGVPLLTNVPEPTTMVLGGLGLATLAFFRRRK